MNISRAVPLVVALVWATFSYAQTKAGLSNEQLVQLTENGITLELGGPGQGYNGSLKLTNNGKGKGSAKTDGGQTIKIKGTWQIQGNKFCRVWKDIDAGEEVCETWVPTSSRSVDVYNGDQKIGVNSW